ncbi:four helix bundle protein [Marinilabiliaceae bacterium JC017]|nr:four helix bundle protein [Marinilabiliaceae bacterium JC017]
MERSIAYQKAFRLAVKIVTYCRLLRDDSKEYELARQLLKSGTSIGANLAEANGAISKADFSNKVSISYKETLETKFWLELLQEVNLIEDSLYQEIYSDSDEIAKILFSILKTTRINKT